MSTVKTEVFQSKKIVRAINAAVTVMKFVVTNELKKTKIILKVLSVLQFDMLYKIKTGLIMFCYIFCHSVRKLDTFDWRSYAKYLAKNPAESPDPAVCSECNRCDF